MTTEDIINEIKERIKQAKQDMRNSKSAGVNSPGFNQDLGAHDALVYLLEAIIND